MFRDLARRKQNVGSMSQTHVNERERCRPLQGDDLHERPSGDVRSRPHTSEAPRS
jgi:hypothetical protein